MGVPSRSAAVALAEEMLSQLPDRWLHTQAVAARADELAGAVPEADRELLRVAAWWHDLGYAPRLTETGFHRLDGARFLEREGYSPRLCALIAHHSAASSPRARILLAPGPASNHLHGVRQSRTVSYCRDLARRNRNIRHPKPRFRTISTT